VSTKGIDSAQALTRARLDFIDIQRGIAVVLMIWMHTADGWLRPELKQGIAWEAIRSVGGLAAPLFFFLAGVGVGLNWRRRAGTQHYHAYRGDVARGLGLMVLGYGLRLQMWMIDAGGLGNLCAWAAALPLGLGYVALFRALSAGAARSGRRTLALTALGVTCVAAGLALVAWLVPDRLRPLLKVDVLQGLGASMVCLALARRPLLRWPALALGLAAATAIATPFVRAAMPGPLPAAVAGYFAAWPVLPGQPIPTLFPLLPWFAYAPLGAAAGIRIADCTKSRDPRRLGIAGAAAGVLATLAFCEPLPLAQAVLPEFPWLTQLLRVGYRMGAVLILGGIAVAISRLSGPPVSALRALGRASLFVYWIHLELAFGTLSRPIARSQGLLGWFVGLVILVAAMAVLARIWSDLRVRWTPSSTQTAVSQRQNRGCEADRLCL
jgi:uncharacterized membrane protein